MGANRALYVSIARPQAHMGANRALYVSIARPRHTWELTEFKNRKSIFFSYDIYGFAINKIYKKTSICISRFFGGIKVVEKLFFVGENKSRYE